jgi:dihydroorotate dehydrogenase electron transfer subunit
MAKLITQPERVSKDHYLLKIELPGSKSVPGQFINIKADRGTDPLLRRPFSVYDHNGDIISVVIRVVGRGTEMICGMDKGEIDIIAPRGRGFTPRDKKRVLLAGGGVGNAPLLYLARILREMGNRITFIYGHRSEEYIYCEDDFIKYADDFRIVTDDGSRGTKGFATDAVRHALESSDYDFIYTCGPVPMMEGVVSAVQGKVPVEVSLENYFGCGVGLCMGCTVETRDGFKRACFDGPVMESSLINWESLKE